MNDRFPYAWKPLIYVDAVAPLVAEFRVTLLSYIYDTYYVRGDRETVFLKA